MQPARIRMSLNDSSCIVRGIGLCIVLALRYDNADVTGKEQHKAYLIKQRALKHQRHATGFGVGPQRRVPVTRLADRILGDGCYGVFLLLLFIGTGPRLLRWMRASSRGGAVQSAAPLRLRRSGCTI